MNKIYYCTKLKYSEDAMRYIYDIHFIMYNQFRKTLKKQKAV